MRHLNFLGFLIFWALANVAQAQPNPLPATPAAKRLEAIRQRQTLQRSSWLQQVPARNIGPTVMSGRVVDVEVNPDDPTEFYVAYATGGVWHTTNHGLSFTCITDSAAAGNFIGDIAMHWPTRTLYLGSGENNSSRSSYAGFGMYVTRDNGKSWQHIGLAESHHIGRVVVSPTDPNTVWVASLGHLYSNGGDRGIFKSTDGGKSWKRTLFVNDTTGAIELVAHPTNPNVLLAATWQRERRAWNFVEGGRGSAIWRSENGGETWAKVSGGSSGFPEGPGVGRIGLDVFPGNGDIVYAVLDNQAPRPGASQTKRLVTRDVLRAINTDKFLSLPADSLNEWLDENNFPRDYTAKSLFEQVRAGKLKPTDLVAWLEDANSNLFNTPITGAELYRSDDGGKTWKKTADKPIDNLFYTYGYYFAQVRVDAKNDKQVYLLGVPIISSNDGGATWSSIDQGNVHSDHHALWVNPKRSGHLINGNDGGLNITYDNGKTWMHCNTPPVGQFYAVAVDNAKPYNVYGGLQDNGVWRGPSTFSPSGYSWNPSYRYEMLVGGDGMQVQVDPRDGTVYTGYQFGNYFRVPKGGGRNKRITPQHKLGQRPYRWNWQSPILLSVHQPDILYFAGDRVFRSFDRGDNFTAISPDLTKGGKAGDVPFGTITSISESPLRFGLLYAGTDDGRVHVSRDGGNAWQDISTGLPANLWVSRVEASPHDTATVLVSLNGYRWDHMDAYVFRSDNYGRTWTRIATSLPAEPVNVVRHDPAQRDLVYVGTDAGLYASFDRGQTVHALSAELPEVPVHDIAIQNRDEEMLVGTHGRSLFILPLKYIRQVPKVRDNALHVFAIDTVQFNSNWGKRRGFDEPSVPEAKTWFWSKTAGPVQWSIQDKDGKTVTGGTVTATAGLNQWLGNLEVPASDTNKASENGKAYLAAGDYKLVLSAGGATAETKLIVKPERKPARRQ